MQAEWTLPEAPWTYCAIGFEFILVENAEIFSAAKICNLHLQLYNPQFRKFEARPPTHENERNTIHLDTPVSGGQFRFQGTGEGFVTADFLKKHCLKEAQQFVCLVQCLSWNSEFPWRHRHFLKQS